MVYAAILNSQLLPLLHKLSHIRETHHSHHITFGGLLILGFYTMSFHSPHLLGDEGTPAKERILSLVPSLLKTFYPHPLIVLPPNPLVWFMKPLPGVLATGNIGIISAYHSGSTMKQLAKAFYHFFVTTPLGLDPEVKRSAHFYVERVETDATKILTLTWVEQTPPPPGGSVTVILPGMNNSSETGFIRHLAQDLTSKTPESNKVCTLDYRGEGATRTNSEGRVVRDLQSPVCASGESWKDLDDVFVHIKKRYPNRHVYCVSQSLGGGMILKYCGERGKDLDEGGPGTTVTSDVIRGVVAMSPPIEYRDIGEGLESNVFAYMCNALMVIPCKIILACSPLGRKSVPSFTKAMFAHSLRSFEEATVVPMGGYKDSNDYYDRNSPGTNLHRIKQPTLIISAKDDPITPPPREDLIAGCPNVVAAVTEFGGHLAFFELPRNFAGWFGLGDKTWGSWGDRVAGEFITGLIEETEEGWRLAGGRALEEGTTDEVTGVRVGGKPSWRGLILGF